MATQNRMPRTPAISLQRAALGGTAAGRPRRIACARVTNGDIAVEPEKPAKDMPSGDKPGLVVGIETDRPGVGWIVDDASIEVVPRHPPLHGIGDLVPRPAVDPPHDIVSPVRRR